MFYASPGFGPDAPKRPPPKDEVDAVACAGVDGFGLPPPNNPVEEELAPAPNRLP